MRADVLVTHGAPSCHELGFAEIDHVADALGVRLIVHGHHHQDYEAAVGRIPVVGVGRAALRVVEIEAQGQ